jgi:hypothetical protein
VNTDGSHGPEVDLARELVEELLRTGLVLLDTLAELVEELPDEAFPGEENAAVLLEMTAGTCSSVARAAGEPACREAIALIVALRERFLHDLKAAAELAADG